MSGTQFWSERMRRYGHTGWSDAAVYAYDQRLRMAALRGVLDALPPAPAATALDFGCGVGDFCALLATRFAQVIGYDVAPEALAVAAQRYPASNIRYVADLDAALAQRHALILSITVLQHVVDDAELQALLHRFAGALAPAGQVVVLETFAGEDVVSNDYLKRRSVGALVAAFGAAGLGLKIQRGFYHPSEAPTPAFHAYRRRPLVRLLARLAGWRVPLVQGWLERLAALAASGDHEFLDRADSPTRWLVFGRGAA